MMVIKNMNKRGISIMIGYILLIVIAIAMSAIVYQWMKSYIPQEDIKCPDGVSVFVESAKCEGNQLTLIIKNNGRFSVDGYFIYGTKIDKTLADISMYLLPAGGEIKLNPGVGFAMDPNAKKTSTFSIPGGTSISSIEITPIKMENKKIISCGDAKIKETFASACGA